LAFDGHRPGASLQLAGVAGRVVLVEPELVVIVVRRDVLEGRLLVHDGVLRTGASGQRPRILRVGLAPGPSGQAGGRRAEPGAHPPVAARLPDGFGGDLGRGRRVAGLADQHDGLLKAAWATRTAGVRRPPGADYSAPRPGLSNPRAAAAIRAGRPRCRRWPGAGNPAALADYGRHRTRPGRAHPHYRPFAGRARYRPP